MTAARLTYCPVGQNGGYAMYESLSDLLTEGFPTATVVEVDNGFDVVTTTIGELADSDLTERFVNAVWARRDLVAAAVAERAAKRNEHRR
jgi:hypothetical protein